MEADSALATSRGREDSDAISRLPGYLLYKQWYWLWLPLASSKQVLPKCHNLGRR